MEWYGIVSFMEMKTDWNIFMLFGIKKAFCFYAFWYTLSVLFYVDYSLKKLTCLINNMILSEEKAGWMHKKCIIY